MKKLLLALLLASATIQAAPIEKPQDINICQYITVTDSYGNTSYVWVCGNQQF